MAQQPAYYRVARNLPFSERRESLAVIYLGRRGVKMTRWIGTKANGAVHFDVGRVVEQARGLGAESLVLVHNHPSGNSKPSQEDVTATSRVQRAARKAGVTLRDHVVVARGVPHSIMGKKPANVKVCTLCPAKVQDVDEHTLDHYRRVHVIAKRIRKEGEKYSEALKRAWVELKAETSWPEKKGKRKKPASSKAEARPEAEGRGTGPATPQATSEKKTKGPRQGRRSGGPSPMIHGVGASELRTSSKPQAELERDPETGNWAVKPNSEAGIELRWFRTHAEASADLDLQRRLRGLGEVVPPNVKREDIPFQTAERAYEGTSHTPDQRAAREQNQYVLIMADVWDAMQARASGDVESQAKVPSVFEEFRSGWLQRKLALLNRRMGLISSMVVGPAKFPARQQEKKNLAFDKASAEFEAWHHRTLKRALERIKPAPPRSISASSPDAVSQLQAKIDKARRLQETMRAANKIVRSKASDEDKIGRLVSQAGLDQSKARRLLEPDFAGRKGFPDYALRNNLAEIKRLEARIAEIRREEERPAQERAFAGGRVTENKDANGLQIFFDEKPDGDTRSKLKAAGFRWSPKEGSWQRQLTQNARDAAQRILTTSPEASAESTGEVVGIGSTTTATGPDPSKVYQLRYRVLPLARVEPSHTDNLEPNPRYPKELQPRLRDRAASRVQIRTMAQNLDPKALITDFHTLDRGPMIVGPDEGQGFPVESGNGRILALRTAQKDFPDKWREYQDLLRDSIGQYGIKAEHLKQIDKAVLIRERLSDVDRVAFTEEANASTAMQMSPLEVALTDAKKLSDEALANLQVGDNQSVDQALQAPANKALVLGFLNKLGTNERAALIDQSGNLNQVGLQRLKSALFAKVYPGDAGIRLTRAFIESLDPALKNVEAAMFDSLPQMARAEGLIGSGQRVADLTIGHDLAEVIDKLAALKQQRITAADFVRQQALVGRDLNPTQEKMLLHFDQFGRSRKALREFLRGYAEAVIAAPHLQQGTMFAGAQESKGDIVSRLIEAQGKRGASGALFELVEARERAGLVADPGRRFPRWSDTRKRSGGK